MPDTLLASACGRAPRRERRKQARPGELLDAALELFVEKGFAATRMEEVATRAGVSKGTVFLYFPSKVELFKAVVRENISGRFGQWNTVFDSYTGSSSELLRDAMLGWWERIGATRASGISKLVISEGGNFPEIAAFFQQEVVQPGQLLLGRIIERGIRRGEFRPVNVPHTVQGVISTMVLLALSRHCKLGGPADGQMPDPVAYLRDQAELISRGLAAAPLGHQE